MDRAEAMRVAASSASVSDKIRALNAAGYPRAEIAKLLGKRYQHVRNVLEGDRLQAAPVGTGVAETAHRYVGPVAIPDVEDRGDGRYRLEVRPDGSVVLPEAVRAAFAIEGRGVVLAQFDGEEFRLISAATGLRRAQELLKPYRWAGGPLASDELIAERRAEAAREAGD